MAESVVFYQSFHNATKDLDNETYGRYMRALNDYAFNDIEPNFSDDDFILKMIFELVRPQIDANKNRKSNGKKGGRPEEKNQTNTENKNLQSIEKKEMGEIKESPSKRCNSEKETATKEKSTRFIKPTVEQVKEYCKERNNSINAERFVDYYESRGWKVGNASMKDWKASIRTWEQRASPQNNIFSEDKILF